MTGQNFGAPTRPMGKILAGPAAAYITGQVITVDGGLSLGVPPM